ncbi:MAG: hypothetical protein GY856_07355 [bacterium]|nr:hypothetical protein [bacterium]
MRTFSQPKVSRPGFRATMLLGAACLVAILLPRAATAQPPAPSEQTIDAEHRAAVIDRIAEALNEIYVFPDVAKKMEEHLRTQLAGGAYDALSSLPAFTRQLTADLQAISHDLHLRVRPAPPEEAEEMSDQERDRRRLEEARYRNFGFFKVERLDGNIGYLDLRSFDDASLAGDTTIAALNFLANSDALIIDLRHNGGGSPSMIQLISSYLFDEVVHLNSFYIRRSDSTRQFWTQSNVRGPKMVSTPIFVLTSRRTFSAAEEFTYNLKHLERATIVGETTGGGAHPVQRERFPELGVVMAVSFGRAVNPITGTNWEGTGVTPHLEVPAAEALDVARIQALKTLLGDETRDERKVRLEWALRGLEATRNPVTLEEAALAAYVGTYGPGRVWLEEGELFGRRHGQERHRLIPMGDDLFGVEGLDQVRILFVRGPSGRVTELIALYANGQREVAPRTGD